MTLESGGRSERRGDEADDDDAGEEWEVRRGWRGLIIIHFEVGNGWPVNYCGYFYITLRTMY